MEDNIVVRKWLDEHPRLEGVAGETQQAKALISTSNVHNLSLGTGYSIYISQILPAILSAKTEVILVTCFFARSATLSALNDALRKLSSERTKEPSRPKLRVRLYFSSSSLFQKLFHTTSLVGQSYAPSEWSSKLGLSSAAELQGLDLQVKSIFVLPFSVMHTKFVMIDRTQVLLPSCNISWEDWFEGCVSMSGPIVEQFVNFWNGVWASDEDRNYPVPPSGQIVLPKDSNDEVPRVLSSLPLNLEDVTSVFLPSPHHQNPQFSILPWRSCPSPPRTPLNTFILTAFANAKKEIYIRTPNLTSPPVLSALLAALRRGVSVNIFTSAGLMILEQLVTAGTTTKRCMNKLKKRHNALMEEWRRRSGTVNGDIEAGTAISPGYLYIRFYQPHPPSTTQSNERPSSNNARLLEPDASAAEPVQFHLKLTIIDGEVVVLGSGNMDRASWYTSQELGVAFVSKEFAEVVANEVDWVMMERTKR